MLGLGIFDYGQMFKVALKAGVRRDMSSFRTFSPFGETLEWNTLIMNEPCSIDYLLVIANDSNEFKLNDMHKAVFLTTAGRSFQPSGAII